MSDKVVFFLPTRKGSERVKNKNTRPFAGINGGLVENKLRQISLSKLVDEIILSTNDEESMRIARNFSSLEPRLRIVPRPEELCLSSTNLVDLIKYVPTITEADHILWGHVTTPLVDGAQYDAAIEQYFAKRQEGYDSLVSVTELRNFLLDGEGNQVNNNTSIPWPRTQDLQPLYEINHAIFLTSREVYEGQQNRIGTRPTLFLMDKIQSLDIDWPEDFVIAETIFQKKNGGR